MERNNFHTENSVRVKMELLSKIVKNYLEVDNSLLEFVTWIIMMC